MQARARGSCNQMLPESGLAAGSAVRTPSAVPSGRLQRDDSGRAAVGQEIGAASGLVVLADGRGGGAQRVQCPQEALVGLVLPGDRAVAVPAGPAELIQAA